MLCALFHRVTDEVILPSNLPDILLAEGSWSQLELSCPVP